MISAPTPLPLPLARPKKKAIVKRKHKDETYLVEKTRLDLFLEEYEKNGGNGTEAALKVFNASSRISAANIATQYLKKAQGLGRMVMEKKGITYEVMVESAWKKHQVEKGTDYFDRLMKMGDYADFISKQGGVTPTTVNVLSVQKGLLDQYVQGEYVDDEK